MDQTFKGCLPQILLGPFLNTLTHMILKVVSCTNNGTRFINTFMRFKEISINTLNKN